MRTKKFLSVICCLLLIIASNFLYSQVTTSGSGWSWYNPSPMGNDVSSFSIAPDGTQYLAGKHGTLLKSTNGGLNFTPMGAISESDLKEIAVLENSLKIVVVGPDGARLSTNGGGIWVSYAPGYTNLNCIIRKDNNIVIGADNGKIIASSNNGQDFSVRLDVPAYTDFKSFYLPGGTSSILAIGSNGKIFYSYTSGWTWEEITNPSGGANLNGVSFANANTGMIVGENSRILKTTNGGLNWYQLVVTMGQNLYDVNMFDANTAIATGDNGKIFRTTDGGNNWSEVYSQPEQLKLFVVGAPSADPSILHVWGESGIQLVTIDAGITWQTPQVERREINRLFPPTFGNRDAFTTGDTLFLSGNSGLFSRSTNAGNSWSTYSTGTSLDIKSGFFINSSTGWLVGGKTSPLQRIILYTSNGGFNWVTQHASFSNNLYDIHFFKSTTGITVGNFGAIMRTTNAGQNWLSISGVTWTLNKLHFMDTSTGVAVGESGKIFRTTNAGLNWIQVNTGGFFDTQLGVDFADASTGISVGSQGTMYRTTNGGINWVQLPQITQNTLQSVYFIDALTGFTCGTNLGNDASILKTTNAGLSWQRQNSGTFNKLNSILFTNSSTGFAVGIRGTILKTTNGGSPIGITQLSQQVPDHFLLLQNYPNPFNPSTKIKFSIPNLKEDLRTVSLKIYDITGREVAVLVNEVLSAGLYNVDFNGTNFSTGVYFYRLKAGDFSVTKKMLLVK